MSSVSLDKLFMCLIGRVCDTACMCILSAPIQGGVSHMVISPHIQSTHLEEDSTSSSSNIRSGVSRAPNNVLQNRPQLQRWRTTEKAV